MKTGDIRVRFTRHILGINSSLFVALFAIKRLVEGNSVNASSLTLKAVELYRYVDGVSLANNSSENLNLIVKKEVKFFNNRGFKLRIWVANCHAKQILVLSASKRYGE